MVFWLSVTKLAFSGESAGERKRGCRRDPATPLYKRHNKALNHAETRCRVRLNQSEERSRSVCPISQYPTIRQDFSISKINILNGAKPTKAFVDVRIGPAIIHGFCVIEHKSGKGFFVAPPAKLGKNQKNYPYVSLDEDFRGPFSKAVIRAYLMEQSRVERKAEVSQNAAEEDEIPF